MRKTFGWIAMLIASSAVLAVPAVANGRDDNRYHSVNNNGYYATAPRYGYESRAYATAPRYGYDSRERLDREQRARLERERWQHRDWDRNAWR
jgi:hypothetical protein